MNKQRILRVLRTIMGNGWIIGYFAGAIPALIVNQMTLQYVATHGAIRASDTEFLNNLGHLIVLFGFVGGIVGVSIWITAYQWAKLQLAERAAESASSPET